MAADLPPTIEQVFEAWDTLHRAGRLPDKDWHELRRYEPGFIDWYTARQDCVERRPERDSVRSVVVCHDNAGKPLTIGSIVDDPGFAGKTRALCDEIIEHSGVDDDARLRARWIRAILVELSPLTRGLRP